MLLPINNWFDEPYSMNDSTVPAGSPDRCLERHVIRLDSTEKLFVLEACPEAKRAARSAQARTLDTLQRQGCPHLAPWLPTIGGEWGAEFDGLFWQLRPWLDGLPLPRDSYAQDAWRGTVMADFLVALKQSSASLSTSVTPFSIVEYIRALLPRVRDKNPKLLDDLLPIWQELDPFSHVEPTLPAAFCHGDFHPNNVIWGEQSIHGVIDWEFSGFKSAGYDVAILLGCLGMDNPEFLTAPMTFAFIGRLMTKDFLSKEAWYWLPEHIAAIRFAWMREWCWSENLDMIVQELDFLWLLLDNRDYLRKRWQLV